MENSHKLLLFICYWLSVNTCRSFELCYFGTKHLSFCRPFLLHNINFNVGKCLLVGHVVSSYINLLTRDVTFLLFYYLVMWLLLGLGIIIYLIHIQLYSIHTGKNLVLAKNWGCNYKNELAGSPCIKQLNNDTVVMWLNIGQTIGISELTKMAAATYPNMKVNPLKWSPMHQPQLEWQTPSCNSILC